MAAAAILNFKNVNIFGHVTVIGFNIWCSVPNFIKIGRYFTEIWRFNDFQNGGRPPSWILHVCIFSRSSCQHAVLLPRTKFRWNWTVGRWVMSKNAIFKMAAAAILNLKKKIQFLVTSLSLGSISATVYQIWSKSDDFSLRYGDLAIFKMAAVRHLGFVMTSQYCIAGHIFVVQILSWNFLSIGVVVSEILAIS